jgi:hypothetical protein
LVFDGCFDIFFFSPLLLMNLSGGNQGGQGRWTADDRWTAIDDRRTTIDDRCTAMIDC